MKRIFILLAIIFGVLLLQIITSMPSRAVAESEQESRKARIEQLQNEWQQKESDQTKIHHEAEAQRRALCNLGEMEFCKFDGDPVTITVTPYNPEVGQTDSSPCVGASGKDLCHLAKTERVAALSQDLVGRAPWKPFHYGDYVYIKGRVAGCTGVFRIEDTMNARHKNYGDIFLMDRADNFGTCVASTVQKLKYNDL
jgi:3D (Asp-Asp-Asp) domain-containing protein